MPHPTGQTPPTATLLYLVPCRKPHVCMTLRCGSHAGCHDVLLTVFIVPSTPPHSTGCKGACYGACHKARHVSFTVNHVGSGLRPLDRPVGAPFRPPCVVNHGVRLWVCPWGVTWRESVRLPHGKPLLGPWYAPYPCMVRRPTTALLLWGYCCAVTI